MTTSAHYANKIVNVTLTGGIIGLLSNSPQDSLNTKIKEENAKGWKVVQVIPADSGNLFLSIFRFLLLICTLLLFTTANGYYVIMEKEQTEKKDDKRIPSADDIKCSECGKEYPSSFKDGFCEECGNQL